MFETLSWHLAFGNRYTFVIDCIPMYILAPLAGYTDKAFRETTALFGSDGSVSEMVSAEGLARSGEKTLSLMDRYPGEKNLSIQLFAPDDETLRRASENLMKRNPERIDINAGCPVPKVVNNGSGSALMRKKGMIGKMVKALREETGLEVSVKFRLGWDENEINFLSFAEEATKAGACQLTMHARTRKEGYSGFAHKEAFLELRKAFPKDGGSPLLFASGDVFDAESAVEYVTKYGMDGVMVARGAIGNPFIFREIKELEKYGKYTKAGKEERLETALYHLRLSISYFGEGYAVREMRKTMMAYVKGLDNSKAMKEKISHAGTYEEYEKALSMQ